MVSRADEPPDPPPAEPVSLDDICVGGTGTYDLGHIQEPIRDVTNKPIKRPFLKRGQGKNCLNNAKPTKTKPVKKVQTRKSHSAPVLKAKKNKENVQPKKTMPPPSKVKPTMRKRVVEEPEDSFNVSLQNEKQANQQLQQQEKLEAREFSALERILSENSKLSLSQGRLSEFMFLLEPLNWKESKLFNLERSLAQPSPFEIYK